MTDGWTIWSGGQRLATHPTRAEAEADLAARLRKASPKTWFYLAPPGLLLRLPPTRPKDRRP